MHGSAYLVFIEIEHQPPEPAMTKFFSFIAAAALFAPVALATFAQAAQIVA